MDEKDLTVTFITEDGDEAIFHVLEETKINGNKYLLVLDDVEDEEQEALILKEVPSDRPGESAYEIVDDDRELNAVAGVFQELIEEIDLVTEN